MDKLGVHRVGLADTVGVSTPFEVQRITAAVCLDPCDSLCRPPARPPAVSSWKTARTVSLVPSGRVVAVW